MLRFYQLLLGVLLVWRVTHLLGAEYGPWHLLERLRSSVSDFWQELIGCFYCLSLWIAAPVACVLGGCWQERLMLWPALVGRSHPD